LPSTFRHLHFAPVTRGFATRVALATYAKAPLLVPDDQLLLPALADLGITGVPVVWNDANADWGKFDAVVVRSCWDYHRNIAAFRSWLDRLERERVAVWNPTAVLRWNSDKTYLHDLADRGVPTIPTARIARGLTASIDAVLDAYRWTQIVVKPCVSASGYETHAFDVPLDHAAREIIRRVLATGDLLVQPFADESPAVGEYSFVFLDGAFSHAALKRATGDEFRVQREHGGTLEPIDASPPLVREARRVLDAVGAETLYARVDGILRDGRFMLMELELIEPNLFLGMQREAPARLAKAIVRAVTA
jgi:glutathione synthase/RimK-type ligase-like ATP-grasp enzyme